MCVVCGCSTGPESEHHPHEHGHAHHAGAAVGQPQVSPATGDLHYGLGDARVSVPGLSQARAVQIEADVLGANRKVAQRNRAHFFAHGVSAVNLVSSPGSGKTTLLCATIRALQVSHPGLPLGVIEGDQQTSVDADRIRATGAPAIQVNTGKGCHLDAPMVADAFERLPLHEHHHAPAQAHDHGHQHDHHHGHHHAEKFLFIENVGNLVCPALWDLGEAAKVAILSVTEGEDKPLKYPDMFAAARLVVLNKIDLLPHLQFDVAQCIENARRVNPGIEVLQVSATTGEGMQAWVNWLMHLEPTL